MKNSGKKVEGITLIALVITIIVLLILAGVALSMVAGNGGLLQKTVDARKANQDAIIKEQKKLLQMTAKANINGETYTETEVKIENEETITRTAKVWPGLALTKIDGESKIFEGLVAIDSLGNEYVWIEVPKTEAVYGNENLNLDTNNIDNLNIIETKLKTYSSAYNSKGGGTDGDEWYGWRDTNKNNVCDSGEIITKAMADNDETGEMKENKKGCGLTYDEYYELKNKMIKSIYENEGFWIGRYEAGTDRARTSGVNYEVFSQMNKYPYFYVTCSQAQTLASHVSPTNDSTSSLMFGVQWNLVLKFIETKIGDKIKNNNNKNILKDDSSDWGNYKSASFELNRGKYWVSGTNWRDYTNLENNLKPASSIILTTGATERNKMLNIYDLAGNVWEWTLQHGTGSDDHPSSFRGGFYDNTVSAAHRDWRRPDRFATYYGFRVAIY